MAEKKTVKGASIGGEVKLDEWNLETPYKAKQDRVEIVEKLLAELEDNDSIEQRVLDGIQEALQIACREEVILWPFWDGDTFMVKVRLPLGDDFTDEPSWSVDIGDVLRIDIEIAADSEREPENASADGMQLTRIRDFLQHHLDHVNREIALLEAGEEAGRRG